MLARCTPTQIRAEEKIENFFRKQKKNAALKKIRAIVFTIIYDKQTNYAASVIVDCSVLFFFFEKMQKVLLLLLFLSFIA